MSNVLSASMPRRTMATMTVDLSRGRVTNLNRCQAFAPSTRAASSGSSEREVSPASRISTTIGVHCQTSTKISVGSAVVCPDSHGCAGMPNQLLSWFGIPAQPWLSGQTTALPTLVFVDVWQWTPMVVLILLAGLTSLSEEPDEAARVDGANAWQRFRFVTLPLLRSTVIVAIVLRGIDALKTFDILYSTKGKGGGSFHEVETLNVYAFGLSFDYNDYGISSTVLVLFFLLIIALMWMVTYRRKGERS